MKSLHACFLFGLMVFSTLGLGAQNQSIGIDTHHNKIEVKEKKLYVNFDIDLSKLNIRSKQGVVLIPVIQSSDRTEALPEVIVNGRDKNISYNRTLSRRKKQPSYNEPYVVVRNDKRDKTIVSYRTVIPFEEWMESSSLVLNKSIYGCNNTVQNISKILLAEKIESPYIPSPLLTYIAPVAEVSHKDQELLSSIVFFPESESEISLKYEQNRPNLMRIDSVLSKNTINSIQITGSASPEGLYSANEELSKDRAMSLAAYLKAHYNISTKLDKIEWTGENWDSLLKLIEQSDMPSKQQVIDIIKSTGVFSGRESELMKLNSGEPYKYMQKSLFPKLRYASYAINCQPIQFDIAKGRELIVSNPQLLSVNEMLLVANSYPHNSSEYKNSIQLTAEMHPENMIANIDASSVALSVGNIFVAKQYLEQFVQQPESWNNLGVISMLEGNYESAYQYFQKAIDTGNLEAVHNMKELNKMR